tara:strand:- start:151 stop:492 length:342 start_codon:yes stop_codon:yes gene_type:complete
MSSVDTKHEDGPADLENIQGLGDVVAYQKTKGNDISKLEALHLSACDIFEQIEWSKKLTDDNVEEVLQICKTSIINTGTDRVSVNTAYIYENYPNHIDTEILEYISDPKKQSE